MGEINWTHEAEAWLRDIYEYIAGDDPAAAMNTVISIYQQAEILREFPEAGYRYWPRLELKETVRVLLYGHYRIAYIAKDNRDIDILGVFHGALDLDRYLARIYPWKQ